MNNKNSLITKKSYQDIMTGVVTTAPEKNKILCQGCAQCCRHVNHEIDPPENDEDCDYIIWFLLHENISIWVDDENVWYVEFKTPCRALKNELCSIYAQRPRVCREYTQDKCLNADLDDDISFNSPEEFLAYLRQIKKYHYHGFYQSKNNFTATFWRRSKELLMMLIGILLMIGWVWGAIFGFNIALVILLLLLMLAGVAMLIQRSFVTEDEK